MIERGDDHPIGDSLLLDQVDDFLGRGRFDLQVQQKGRGDFVDQLRRRENGLFCKRRGKPAPDVEPL